MAPHSSTLAWKIPWTEEPGRLQSMGSLGVGNDWATSLSLFTFMHWRRKWQPTPVFLPGESQPGELPYLGSHRVGHDWSDLAAAAVAGWFPILPPGVARFVFSLSPATVAFTCALKTTGFADLPPVALRLFFCRGEGSELGSLLFSEEAAASRHHT